MQSGVKTVSYGSGRITGKLVGKWLAACGLVLSGAVSSAETPSDETITPEQWDGCVVRLQQEALDKGIPSDIVQGPLAGIQYVPKVIELDRRQPEFTTTFSSYITRRVDHRRVARGRKMLREHRELLNQLVKEYGIPAQYLVAFWGLETNYGSYLGKMPTLDSLATLACDQRRSRFFTAQLMEALKLLQVPGVEHPMRGSWAGAVGHTQFMPTAYLKYAIDGDGDGKKDLWGSIPDALTSAANFLNNLGWQRDLRWGREVQLPDGFDFALLGFKQKRSLKQWRAMGLLTATGAELADLDLPASVLLPAGYRGPAFLVYHNFDVIMGWNRSVYYALSVGHLADRINGAGKLQRSPPKDLKRLSIAQVKELQTRLNAMGYDTGNPDGILGPATRTAISAFQQSREMVADGYPRSSVFEALEIEL